MVRRCFIFEGRGARGAAREAGMSVRRFLPIGPRDAPDLLLSLEDRRAAAYALGRLGRRRACPSGPATPGCKR